MASPPRLLVVTTAYDHIKDFLLPFAAHLRAQGWRVDALARRDATYEECAPAFDRAWEIDWSREPSRPGNLAQARRVRRLVERERYDVVHAHTPIAAFVTRVALRRLRRRGGPRVVYTAHGFHFQPGGGRLSNALYLGAERLASRWTDHLVVINRLDEEAARAHRLVPDERLVYMPGIGIDTDWYDARRLAADDVVKVRAELDLRPDDRLFLMIAEFTPNKRHRDAIGALARLADPRAHLALAGRDGTTRVASARLAEELGLAGRVHFLGYRTDIPALIHAADATLLVSGREGLPRSVLESMCLATPVIGTRIRGVSELLATGAGALVEVGDVEGIAAAMRRILDDRDEARAMGERGRERVDDYALERVVALHDDLYARALGRAAAPEPVGAATGGSA
jgi:glycosyltransferase involved in cell wall biosynthesis